MSSDQDLDDPGSGALLGSAAVRAGDHSVEQASTELVKRLPLKRKK